MWFLWAKKEKETGFFDTGSSNTNVFNADRNFFHVLEPEKYHNSQFHAKEITHLHCKWKNHFKISRSKNKT